MAALTRYLSTVPPARLSPAALSILGLLGVTFVVCLWWSRRGAPNLLQRQARRRLGHSIATWAAIESVLILWRLLGMGDTRLIPALGLAVGVLLVSYAIWFIIWRLPRLQWQFDRLREEFEVPYARKRLGTSKMDGSSASGWPTVGAGVGGLVLWLAMVPSVDHALHWVVVFLGGAQGYSAAEALTAGEGIYTLAYRASQLKAIKKAVRRSSQQTDESY